ARARRPPRAPGRPPRPSGWGAPRSAGPPPAARPVRRSPLPCPPSFRPRVPHWARLRGRPPSFPPPSLRRSAAATAPGRVRKAPPAPGARASAGSAPGLRAPAVVGRAAVGVAEEFQAGAGAVGAAGRRAAGAPGELDRPVGAGAGVVLLGGG